MTVVSNDPSWWPFINANNVVSYWIVVTVVVVVYDWTLTLGQEIKLIWRQRCSTMTVLYLVIRYIGIPFAVANALSTMPSVSLTDTGCNIIIYAVNWTDVVQAALVGVIMIARLYAMYQRSRTILIFLVITFLGINIACIVMTAIGLKHYVAEELILSGMHVCGCSYGGGTRLLMTMVWMLNAIWEVLALCLSAWIAVKHFGDLRRDGPSAGSTTVGDCFTALVKSHVLYFACFASVSCLQFSNLSLVLTNSDAIGPQILYGAFGVLLIVQKFVLGPRLILSVREYHAKHVADSDAETSMDSIVFQEHVHISTSTTV